MLILPTIIKNHLKAQTFIYNCIYSLFCLLVIFTVTEMSDCYHWRKPDIRLQRLGNFPCEAVATPCFPFLPLTPSSSSIFLSLADNIHQDLN